MNVLLAALIMEYLYNLVQRSSLEFSRTTARFQKRCRAKEDWPFKHETRTDVLILIDHITGLAIVLHRCGLSFECTVPAERERPAAGRPLE